jgi:hypothetical protein
MVYDQERRLILDLLAILSTFNWLTRRVIVLELNKIYASYQHKYSSGHDRNKHPFHRTTSIRSQLGHYSSKSSLLILV